ncbi:hypothetical protein [Natrialbaceae archaeon AArc-T1-2]|uniref:hypothetical protein n=1 Tax=Natrialbaceae archaeon AArc-T1-2 TaxID=3053904 RepID=UPI00255B0201|nr:hypothetical protein [Natrialbaceae archaeon AArc-T1-2]WIV65885.1 hypothetical protein QQ977_09245 [Natrialbaceae archaeon AArc-T1-2]
MGSDKKAVHEELVDAVETVVDRTVGTGVVEFGQDNWYVTVAPRQDALVPSEGDAVVRVASEEQADIEEEIGDSHYYYRHVPDVVETLETALTEDGFAAKSYRSRDGQAVRVLGWDRDPSWFRDGDYVKLYRWRTPLEVVAVAGIGERPPAEFPTPVDENGDYVGADSIHLCLRGNRGGEYLVDAVGGETALYHREDSDADVLEKASEITRTIFVGNPETGPRLEG